MLDIKPWLETTGIKVAEGCFLKPPALPYVIFNQEHQVSGADNKNCISDRDISVELYSDKINHEAEQKIEDLLNEKAIGYKRDRTWIDSERFFQTVYDFSFTEKI